MRILNWNTQADRLRAGTAKFERLRHLVTSHEADVICLTEALPESMPEGGETVASHLSGWKHEARGARKVVLWSRFGWTAVDTRGDGKLPEGRFVRATTNLDGTDLTFVGMCIPYSGYRTNEKWWGAEIKELLAGRLRISGCPARRNLGARNLPAEIDLAWGLQYADSTEGETQQD